MVSKHTKETTEQPSDAIEKETNKLNGTCILAVLTAHEQKEPVAAISCRPACSPSEEDVVANALGSSG